MSSIGIPAGTALEELIACDPQAGSQDFTSPLHGIPSERLILPPVLATSFWVQIMKGVALRAALSFPLQSSRVMVQKHTQQWSKLASWQMDSNMRKHWDACHVCPRCWQH